MMKMGKMERIKNQNSNPHLQIGEILRKVLIQ